LTAFGETVREFGLDYLPQIGREAVAANADVLITVTPSQQALVQKQWVRPGTHISAMGADTKGKQELDPSLVATTAIFVDEAAQSFTIGECQHAYAAGLIGEKDVRASLGSVIAGIAEGRRSADEITLFDGTGVSLQDLVVANLAVKRATEQGLGASVDF
ncbi:MAG: ornithine cyclodeaminase family protein, partial [Mesorhizobium sp.]